MPTKKIFNIKYGNKNSLPETTSEGTLYVATKENNRAELFVDLDSNRYLISDATTKDEIFITTDDIDEICGAIIQVASVDEVVS